MEQTDFTEGIRYYSDTLHNYMILPCDSTEEEGGDYRYRMLAANRIAGLLPCAMRYIDGRNYLYYEITAMQTLGNLYGRRAMSGGQLRALLEQLLAAMRTLEEFLLGAEGLLLSEELVFYDPETSGWFFTYALSQTLLPSKTGFLVLAEFLAEHIDPRDKWAAACSYRFATLAENPNYILQESIFGEDGRDAGDARWVETEEPSAEREAEAPLSSFGDLRAGRTRGKAAEAKAAAFGEPYAGRTESEADWMEQEGWADAEKPEEKPHTFDAPELCGEFVLCGLFAAVVLLLLWIRNVFRLSETELFADRAGILGALLLSAFMAARGILRIFSADAKKRVPAPKAAGPGGPNAVLPEDEERKQRGIEDTAEEGAFLEKETNIPPEELCTAPVLCGTAGQCQYRVEQGQLPCVIGKMRGFVDVEIDEAGISQMHARLERRSGEIWEVEDLNSTGGTYVNGKRLMPNEKSKLCRQDELRIGGVTFVLL